MANVEASPKHLSNLGLEFGSCSRAHRIIPNEVIACSHPKRPVFGLCKGADRTHLGAHLAYDATAIVEGNAGVRRPVSSRDGARQAGIGARLPAIRTTFGIKSRHSEHTDLTIVTRAPRPFRCGDAFFYSE
jgi:hypothetical protein